MKPKVLALHGFRTSAAILKMQARDLPLGDFDLHFLDGPTPATG